MKAISNFQGESKAELTFKEKDLIRVLEQHPSGQRIVSHSSFDIH